ncbi:ligand-effect modulator 3 family [Lineolata rhizophorae]|uniref:Ligand-effect modulator 3 family n=1 Tax=Lineolata rhizophorae TaxID=578093 RepID=A0A6A6NSJ9_9PEZI|nr:ligand-effect modulator 3 family [Lineolata rhizophorae]
MTTTQQQLEPADSISSQDPTREELSSKKTKSRRPANTAFRQQRLKAWQPILTPKTVLPLFFIIGIIFAPIGGLLLWASSKVEELSIDYTECTQRAPLGTLGETDPEEIPSDKWSSHFNSGERTQPPKWLRAEIDEYPLHPAPSTVNITAPVCYLQFNIPNNIGPPVLFYYRLSNFYQNHRRYVKSFDAEQLKGHAKSNSSIDGGGCDPLRLNETEGKAYYPCGLIANSLFNDTYESPKWISKGDDIFYNMTDKGIAWDNDKDLYGETDYTLGQVTPPPNWRVKYPQGYTETEPMPDLQNMENFQVWMRTAGLPTFSKLALRNDTDPMQAGTYVIEIRDFFDVSKYEGTKSILISTRTVMGGKNPFLGIAYVVVGGICVLLGALFTAAHLIKPRKLGDHTYLSWNNDQPTTATATGRAPRPGDTA